jgi:hypothetical protein
MKIIVSTDSLDRTSYAAVELMNRFIGPNDEKVYKAWKGDD